VHFDFGRWHEKEVGGEDRQVLKAGGVVLWYDYFVSNPKNSDVRGVKRREIVSLFPGFSIFLKRVTLTPLLARAVGPISSSLYRLFASVRPLRTHYLDILQKQ
jgi:hypothetical protein